MTGSSTRLASPRCAILGCGGGGAPRRRQPPALPAACVGLPHPLIPAQALTPAPASATADTRFSAACFTAWLALFVPWLLVFAIGGPAIVGADVYNKLDVARLNLAALGLQL